MIHFDVYKQKSATDGNAPYISSTTVTGTNTYYSDMWPAQNSDGYGLSVFFTGTPTGTFTLWMTDKRNPSLADDSDWIQDTGFTPTNPAGAAGKFRDDASNAKAMRKRLKYVNASGTGTILGIVSVPQMR